MVPLERESPTLRLLCAQDARLAARVAASCPPPRFRILSGVSDTPLRLSDNSQDYTLVDPPPSWGTMAAADFLLCFGIGDGALVARALSETPVRVAVLEPELDLVRHVLTRHDWSAAVLAGRLRVFTVTMGNGVLDELAQREVTALVAGLLHAPGAVMHTTSTSSAPLHEKLYAHAHQAAMSAVQTINTLRRERAHAVAHDVTVVSPRCVIFDDLGQTFQRLGYQTRLLSVPDVARDWTEAQRLDALASLARQPSKLVITRNRVLLETDYAQELPQPEFHLPGAVANWWWDVPNVATMCDGAAIAGGAHSLGFARDLLATLPRGAQWLPPAARSMFAAAPLAHAEPDIDISFVGQSRLSTLRGNLSNLLPMLDTFAPGLGTELRGEVESQRGFAAIYTCMQRRQATISATIARLRVAFPAVAYYLGYLLEMVVTGAFRIAAIERLAREGIAVHVFGDDGWVQSGAVQPGNFRGVLPVDQLVHIYQRSRISLNLNFMQVSSTVNPKVLDIAACGGVPLTDYRPELDLLYPNSACRPFSFGSLDELVVAVRALLGRDLSSYRERLAVHTRAEHTMEHRARWLAERFGLARA